MSIFDGKFWVDIGLGLAEDHWLKTVVLITITVISGYAAGYWGRQNWRKRQDLEMIHFSQNKLQDRPGPEGTTERWLILDALEDGLLETFVPHEYGRKLIVKAAKKTTAQEPLLLFDESERCHILDKVRIAIAKKFFEASAAKMAGLPVKEIDCVFAITFERYPKMREGKIRVIIVEKAYLDNPTTFDGDFRMENEDHADRITTLKLMQKDYQRGVGKWRHCMQVRINVKTCPYCTPSRQP